jgi:putative hydrolase of the HAD superfamily
MRTVLLDCFGTMVHCPWRAIRHRMADRAGVPAERLLQGYKITRPNRNTGVYPDATAELTAVCEAADLSLTARQVRELVRFECELLTVHGDYYPDALRFVDRVRASGIAVGMVSNCSPSAACLFERLQPHRYVDDVVLSFQVGYRKPDERIYRTALRRLNEDNPGQCLFVDDEREFCQGAEAVGITTSLIDRARRTTGLDGTCIRTFDDLVIAVP